MAGINKVIIIGRLGKDPEMRTMQNGKSVATLSVATSETWKDQQGQKQEKTEWHKVIYFDKLADICGQYLQKGSLIYLEGKLQTRKWQDQQGADRYTTEILGNSLQMLGGKSEEGQAKPQQKAPQKQQGWDGYADNERFDDDIPF